MGSEKVRVEVVRGRTIVASGPGVWVSSEQPSPYEALVYRHEDGANELSEIRFRHSADAIRVEGAEARADAGHGDASPPDIDE